MNMPHAGRLSLSLPQTEGLQTDLSFTRLRCHIFLWQLHHVAKMKLTQLCKPLFWNVSALFFFFTVGNFFISCTEQKQAKRISHAGGWNARHSERFSHVQSRFTPRFRKNPKSCEWEVRLWSQGFCERRFVLWTERLWTSVCHQSRWIHTVFFSKEFPCLQLLTELSSDPFQRDNGERVSV